MENANIIEIKLDIYPNRFGDDMSIKYVYANIKAIDPSNQEKVDECIQQMEDEKNPYLLKRGLIVLSPYTPIETSKIANLDIENKLISIK